MGYDYKHARRRLLGLLLLVMVGADEEFMEFCTSVLGIYSTVYIKDFEHNVSYSLPNYEDDMMETQTTNKTIMERGLAASKDIQPDDVVLRIPLQAILSVQNFILSDPILGQYITTSKPEDDLYYLAIGILHHRSLNASSPIYRYIQILPQTLPNLPIFWDAHTLRTTASEGVRQITQTLRKEIVHSYNTIVLPLLQNHPEIFDPVVYSLEQYRYAFGMVHSRHWQLPVPHHHQPQQPQPLSTPPASTPSDSHWGSGLEQREEDDVVVDHQDETQPSTSSFLTHSFLAPVADLMNFGRPCTKTHYTEQYFEIVSVCHISRGDEITFWYSNECEDILYSVYGLTHPLIPPCKTYEEWRSRVEDLEDELDVVYGDVEELEDTLEQYESTFSSSKCDCCKNTHHESHNLRSQENELRRSNKKKRGRSSNNGARSDKGLRRWSRKTEF